MTETPTDLPIFVGHSEFLAARLGYDAKSPLLGQPRDTRQVPDDRGVTKGTGVIGGLVEVLVAPVSAPVIHSSDSTTRVDHPPPLRHRYALAHTVADIGTLARNARLHSDGKVVIARSTADITGCLGSDRIALQLVRITLGCLILATGIGKALDLPGFIGVIETYQLGLGDTALRVFAPAISVLEIALGAWILGGWRLGWSMWCTILLNAGYFALLTSALARGLDLPNCGCFGVYLATPLRWYSPLEDLAIIALSTLVLCPVRAQGRARD